MEAATRWRGRSGRRVLCLVMNSRLLGIDLDALESPSRSYNPRKTPKVYPKPKLVFDLDFRKYGLPVGMGAFKSTKEEDSDRDTSIIYLVGGIIEAGNHRDTGHGTPTPSTAIYEFEVPHWAVIAGESFVPLATPEIVGMLLAPKVSPIVKTLAAGKTYVMVSPNAGSTFLSSPIWWISEWSPFLELLDFDPQSALLCESSSSGTPSTSCVLTWDNDYSVLHEPFCGPEAHFVIGSRMFLRLFDRGYPPFLCFDGAAEAGRGAWVTDFEIPHMLKSFEPISYYIDGGRSVSIPDFALADDFCGQKPINLFLFYVSFDDDIRYFVGVVLDSGVLLCYQEITHEIFEAPTFSLRLQCGRCFFLDGDGSRAYAVLTGNEYPRDSNCIIICVSEFNITKLSVADHVIYTAAKESLPIPAKETEFVRISSVKNYICSTFDHKIEDLVDDVFLL